MILFKDIDKINGLLKSHEAFYNALPAIIGCFLIYSLAFSSKDKNIIIIVTIVLVINAYVNYNRQFPTELQYSDELKRVDAYVDFSRHKYATIPISPYAPWSLKVPIDENYCWMFKCEE